MSDRPVALITGASGALGRAVVRRRLDQGGRVALFDRRTDRLAADVPELAQAPDRAAAYDVDLADAAAVEHAVGAAFDRFGRVDAAFNLAGAYRGGSIENTSEADWQLLLDANFRSTLHVCRTLAPRLRAQGGGAIVNIGSRASLAGGAGAAAYSVAKTAVLRLTESLAAELKRDGVRVNCVLPGTIDTPANRAAMPDADASEWVELDALVDVLAFLASPAARAVHGAALPVFGTA